MDKNIDPCEGCRRNCEIPCWKVEHGLLVPTEVIQKERETLRRVEGIIEGVSCCVDEGAAEALVIALEMIDGILEGEQDNG